jgi:hypothetical protein
MSYTAKELTTIWNAPKSESDKILRNVFKVDIAKPKQERKEIYHVSIRYEDFEDFEVEANSVDEAISLAKLQIPENHKILQVEILP